MKRFFLPLLFLSIFSFSMAEAKPKYAESFIGKQAPELLVDGWVSEKPELGQGKFLLIDFWASWCAPCKKSIPDLNEYQEKYREKLDIVGVSLESKSKAKNMDDPELMYYSAYDSRKRMKKALGLKGIPYVLIINPEGIVVWEGAPFQKGNKLTEEIIQKLLAES